MPPNPADFTVEVENKPLVENEQNEQNGPLVNGQNEQIRFNAFKKLILNGSELVILCCIAALTDAYIENKLTDTKFNSFSQFLKQTSTYLTWGVAALGFSIFTDKTAFHFLDVVINEIKELVTGKKYLTKEEELEKQIINLEKKLEEMEIKLTEQNEVTKNLQKVLNQIPGIGDYFSNNFPQPSTSKQQSGELQLQEFIAQVEI